MIADLSILLKFVRRMGENGSKHSEINIVLEISNNQMRLSYNFLLYFSTIVRTRLFPRDFFPDIFVIENFVIEKSRRTESIGFMQLSRRYPKLQIKIIPRTIPFCFNVRSISTVSKDFCFFSQELELLFRTEARFLIRSPFGCRFENQAT